MATVEKNVAANGTVTYAVRYRTPDRKTTRKRGFATKRDANAFAATVETSKLKGEYVSTSAGRATVGELGEAWLGRQRGHLKPTTAYCYERAWRTVVAPRWADVRVGDIRPSDVQGWVSELRATRGPQSIRQAHSIFGMILADAVKDRLLVSNPARDNIKLPKRAPRRNIYLTGPQLLTLADASGQYRSLVLLLGVGGLRWGEAIGLRPCDIDFLHRRIELHRNVVVMGGKFHVGTLKTGENRTVVLPTPVIEALAVSCEGKSRDELIWTGPMTGGYMHPPSQYYSWLPGAVRRCQKIDPAFPRVTPHALRHTAASLAVQAGAHVKAIQRMLGHASAAMTLDVYADLFESDLDVVAENMAKAVWPQQDIR